MKKKKIKKNKKKRGFTLIELLAVILILGIIALIAIPTVNGVVEQARRGAYENAVESVIKAINQYSLTSEMSGNSTLNGVYQFSYFKDKLDLNGDYDIDGWVELSNGEVINYSFSNDKYVVRGDISGKVTKSISDLGSSTLISTKPYYDEYKSLISNIYVTYGKLPNEYTKKWDMASGDNPSSIVAYIKPNSDDKTLYDLFIVSENKIIAPEDMKKAFFEYDNVKSIIIDNLDTSNTKIMSWMFAKNPKLEVINISKLNTSNVTHMCGMFAGGEVIDNKIKNDVTMIVKEIIGLENLDMSSVQYTNYMFYRETVIESLDLSHWNTPNLYNMQDMFSYMYNLKTINLTNLKTNKVAYFTNLFKNDYQLVELDLRSFNTSSATNMAGMFMNTIALEKVDMSSFNTKNVTDMSGMFAGGAPLEDNNFQYTKDVNYIGLENFNTSKVKNMSKMFYRSGKTSIDLSSWNTSELRNVSQMFRTTFLETIDLSGWSTVNFENVSDMFRYTSTLRVVYIGSNWNLPEKALSNSSNMFESCSKLKNYNKSYIDGTYANADGYLTLKN